MDTFCQAIVSTLGDAYCIQYGYNDRMQNRLRFIREDRGLTQEELAEKANTTKAQISKLEKGQRRLSMEWTQRLARVLECHPFELIEEAVAVVTPQERAVLELYRGLAEADKTAFLQIATSLPKSASDSPSGDGEGDPASRPRRSAA